MKIRYLFYIIAFFSTWITIQGQTSMDTKQLCLEGRYAEAFPILKAEYKLNPETPALNQLLGVCAYEMNDFKLAQKCLTFAAQKNIPDAHFYLGKLLTKTYRFADAETHFSKYQRAKRRDKEALAKLEEQREYAQKLKRATQRTEDILIIDSVIVYKTDFLSAYTLSASSGSLLPMKAFFKNLPDHKDLVLYMNERNDKMYYSQGDSATGLKLYSMEKLLDTFGNEKKLPESVNGAGNQAYPFVMPDGLTLYFASTGHSSFGGYDLFVTRYNLSTDTYLTPNQLNMPFNSPFNDYMMAVDEEKGVGWFASDRFQPNDSVCIYTFIPSRTVTLLESDNEITQINRARIASIKDTWKEGVDYSPLLRKARQSVQKENEPDGDFEFVINDALTYRRFSDFKSASAQQLFRQALDTEKRLQTIQKELSDKRSRFAAGGNDKENLRSSILNLEQQSEALYTEIERLKIQARNDEIRNSNSY